MKTSGGILPKPAVNADICSVLLETDHAGCYENCVTLKCPSYRNGQA